MSFIVDWKCLYEGMGKCREELKMENNIRKFDVRTSESFNSTVIKGQVQVRQRAEKKPGDSEPMHKPLWASMFSLVGFLFGILRGRWTWEQPFVSVAELMVDGGASVT